MIPVCQDKVGSLPFPVHYNVNIYPAFHVSPSLHLFQPAYSSPAPVSRFSRKIDLSTFNDGILACFFNEDNDPIQSVFLIQNKRRYGFFICFLILS